MSESKIHSALVSAYLASGVMPQARTAFEGKSFTPPTGQSWARLTGLPSGRAPAGLGSAAPQEWTGILQIDLFHPKNTGHADLLAGADAAMEFFRSGRRLIRQGQSVLIRRAERSQIRQEDVWQSVSISVYCTAQTTAEADNDPWIDPNQPDGIGWLISDDAGNTLSLGSDERLYVAPAAWGANHW